MLKLKVGFILLLNLTAFCTSAKIDFNKNCTRAFEDIFRLKLPKADEQLASEINNHPDNALAYYLKGLSEIINVFINEDSKSYKKLKISIPDKLKKIKKYGGESAYTELFRGQLLFYYGITQTKFDDLFSAGYNIRDSYLILKNNALKYPDFLPNNTIMGVVETFSGTIPASYKWIVNIFGVKASVLSGMQKLDKFTLANISKGSELEYFKLESNIFQGGLYHLVLHKENTGWKIINANTLDYKTNLLSTYLRSSFLIKTGQCEEAVNILTNRPQGSEYINMQFLDYLMGSAKLCALDADAEKFLKTYISGFKGRNYLKSACQKLAWFYLIKGDYANYKVYMEKISTIGYELTDEDKQASKSAVNKNYTPNISLLRARLLFDGGYFDRALKELEGKSTKNYSEKRDQVEFIYRLARIYQKQGKEALAISYFQKTITAGKNLPQYYAMASCIEIASIYEMANDPVKARTFYEKSLTFTKNREYVNSLEQRAKAGIERLSR